MFNFPDLTGLFYLSAFGLGVIFGLLICLVLWPLIGLGAYVFIVPAVCGGVMTGVLYYSMHN